MTPTASPTPTPTGPPNLASLIELSKTALQTGQQLGSTGDELSRDSSTLSFEVQIIDARLRWLMNAVLEQLKLASSIAKSLSQRQDTIQTDIKQWDATRDQRSKNLDQVLDKLATQYVPPEFHQLAVDEANAIFKTLDDDVTGEEGGSSSNQASLNQSAISNKWRTLRDFVDEKGIVDASEAMDEDRLLIDDLLATRADNPAALEQQISDIRESIIPSLDEIDVTTLMNQRDAGIHEMAARVESLAGHYDQLEDALKASEAGEQLHNEDLEVFIQDTNELSNVIAELEHLLSVIQGVKDTLLNHKEKTSSFTDKYPDCLKLLDDLSAMMSSMVQQQDQLEEEVSEYRSQLQTHLETLEDLCATYESYQLSFNVLVLELDRRREWSDGISAEVTRMKAVLAEARETELQRRQSFMATYGSSLPDDLCHSIANVPTLFDIIPIAAEELGRDQAPPAIESHPAIPVHLLAEARAKVESAQIAQLQDSGS